MSNPNYFVIPGRLPGLNEVLGASRASKYVGARIKKETDDSICWSIRRAMMEGHCRKAEGPVRLEIEWYETNRKRDLDNIFSGKKFILDAMQRMKILEGDGQKYVVGLRDDFCISHEAYIKVRIVAADED